MARIHTVAAAHAASVFLDVSGGVARARDLVAQAGREGIELLVFPEVFIPGFPYWINLYPPAIQRTMIARYHDASLERQGPEMATIREACARAGVAIVLGFSERAEGGRTCYNAQAFIDRDGSLLGVHRKLQPTESSLPWIECWPSPAPPSACARSEGSRPPDRSLTQAELPSLVAVEQSLKLTADLRRRDQRV